MESCLEFFHWTTATNWLTDSEKARKTQNKSNIEFSYVNVCIRIRKHREPKQRKTQPFFSSAAHCYTLKASEICRLVLHQRKSHRTSFWIFSLASFHRSSFTCRSRLTARRFPWNFAIVYNSNNSIRNTNNITSKYNNNNNQQQPPQQQQYFEFIVVLFFLFFERKEKNKKPQAET